MKKFMCAVLVLVICIAMAAPAFAAESQFVPSISFKDAPGFFNAFMTDENGEKVDVASCIVVTSILGAQNKTTDISQAKRDELLSVYEKLSDGSMTLPASGKYTIRELVDVSFTESCVGAHNHEELLNKAGTTVSVTFEIGTKEKLTVLQYKGGSWKDLVSVKNNGDGTFTCVFEDFCPVVFLVGADDSSSSVTGDAIGQNMGLWIALMAVSAAALVTILFTRRKIAG